MADHEITVTVHLTVPKGIDTSRAFVMDEIADGLQDIAADVGAVYVEWEFSPDSFI